MARTKSNKEVLLARDKVARSKPMRWTTERRYQLLAYLDWCVQNGQDFPATAGGHIGRLIGQEITTRQVLDRLRGEWQKYKLPLFKTYRGLLYTGTSGLSLTVQDEREISAIFAHLSTPSTSPPPRVLRSGSSYTIPALRRTCMVLLKLPKRQKNLTKENATSDEPVNDEPIIVIPPPPIIETSEDSSTGLIDDAETSSLCPDASIHTVTKLPRPGPAPEQPDVRVNAQQKELNLKSQTSPWHTKC